jgi:predicted acyl esterase
MRTAIRALAVTALTAALGYQGVAQTPDFAYQHVMIPVRDGARLETVIMTPTHASGPLPILVRRTPYGVPANANGMGSAALKDFVRDGYIFVVQNLRGRFQSEGTFELSSKADLKNPKATSETTDAYDSIDWLVKNVPNNNGKVGIYGVSYDGLTAAMTLLQPHPALKAISEQASPADQWMNDDDHRYGALRESYAFEYAVYEQADKNANTHFAFETYDTYSWYLNLGPLGNIAICPARFRTGIPSSSIPTTTRSGKMKRG